VKSYPQLIRILACALEVSLAPGPGPRPGAPAGSSDLQLFKVLICYKENELTIGVWFWVAEGRVPALFPKQSEKSGLLVAG